MFSIVLSSYWRELNSHGNRSVRIIVSKSKLSVIAKYESTSTIYCIQRDESEAIAKTRNDPVSHPNQLFRFRCDFCKCCYLCHYIAIRWLNSMEFPPAVLLVCVLFPLYFAVICVSVLHRFAFSPFQLVVTQIECTPCNGLNFKRLNAFDPFFVVLFFFLCTFLCGKMHRRPRTINIHGKRAGSG